MMNQMLRALAVCACLLGWQNVAAQNKPNLLNAVCTHAMQEACSGELLRQRLIEGREATPRDRVLFAPGELRMEDEAVMLNPRLMVQAFQVQLQFWEGEIGAVPEVRTFEVAAELLLEAGRAFELQVDLEEEWIGELPKAMQAAAREVVAEVERRAAEAARAYLGSGRLRVKGKERKEVGHE